MIKFRLYSSVQKSKIIDTGGGMDGFKRNRKYDTDFDRLSRHTVQNELSSNQLNSELNKARKELRGL
jgi:hypothetical protein